MSTGKGEGSIPHGILQYRGLPFSNRTYGILNVTGSDEGVAFSQEESTLQLTWDSVLSRAVMAQYTGTTEI